MKPLNLFSTTCFRVVLSTLFTVFLFKPKVAQAQADLGSAPSAVSGIQKIAAAIDTFNKVLPAEKLFIHTDKSHYSSLDTIWFKGYLFDAQSAKYSSKSGLVYLELISDSATVFKRISVVSTFGICLGQIILDETIPEGAYTLRAYTNWMQNLGEQCFFKKTLHIITANPDRWLVTENHQLKSIDNKRQLQFNLTFKTQQNSNIGYKVIDWRVLDGKKTFMKGSTETLNGEVNGIIPLVNNPKNSLIIVAEDKANPQQKAVIPLNLSTDEEIDLQFMPESGHLVANIPAKVAFKAIAKNGLGVDVSGVITNSKNTEVTTFKSLHNGMGVLYFNPEPNESYIAKLSSHHLAQTFRLPETKSAGIILKASNKPESDSVRITVLLSGSLVNEQNYYLTGLARNIFCYGASFKANQQQLRATISKKLFPTGVVHFTLFNEQNQPVAERILYIDHKDDMAIQITTDKTAYQLRDSIPLTIAALDNTGKPINGSFFSLAVTDDSQVAPDTLQGNLITNFYLESELKSKVENPSYYFSKTAASYEALDVLLLAQGWIGYNWTNIFKPQHKPAFIAEPNFAITGKVTNVVNKPVAKSRLILYSSQKNRFTRDTLSNQDGRFVFNKFPAIDTVAFIVQARTKNGKSFNIGIEIDKFIPAKPIAEPTSGYKPWYVNSDSTALSFGKNKSAIKQHQDKIFGKNVLKDVVITAKKIIPNSKNLSPGMHDQIISEAEIEKANTQKLIDLLHKKVKGFSVRSKMNQSTKQYRTQFYLFDKPLHFIVDGTDLEVYYDSPPPEMQQYNPDAHYQFIIGLLDQFTPDEIVGIEVMYSNALKYNAQYAKPSSNIAYLEITTRSGTGIATQITPGIAVYKPIPLTWQKEFYKPKYTLANMTKNTPDMRSTIHWQPHLYTNMNGKASTYFYAADKPGTYTITLQGSNMLGLFGYKTMKLKIENTKSGQAIRKSNE